MPALLSPFVCPAPRRWAPFVLAFLLFGVVPRMAHAQGAMTNGEAHTGAISIPGEQDLWTFDATAGEYVVIGIGETGGTDTAFVPWIELLSPTMTSLSSASGPLAAQISLNVNVTGTFTVRVRSNDSGQNDTGTYVLTLAKAPGAFVVPASDTGGALTNGSNHAGSVSPGDLDMWSFTAGAGEYFVLGLGEAPPAGPDPGFVPWLRVVGPNGTLYGNESGANVAQVSLTAAVSGTYTAIVGTADSFFDASGDYSLTLVKATTALTISNGDEGGDMTNGAVHPGAIHVGDLDAWRFTAAAGEYIVISAGEVPPSGADPLFAPWVRLVGPTGALIGSESAANVGQFSVNAPASGTYTVIVGTFDSGLDAAGDYLLTLAKAPGTFTVSGGDQGGPLTNGSNHAGALYRGDLDTWSFTATSGEYVVVGIGEVPPSGVDPGFSPWIRVIGPTGGVIGSESGANAAQISFNAAAAGTYSVIVATFDSGLDATGDYLLTLAKAPGAFTISLDDQGGSMSNGSNHTGSIHTGDLDMWSFSATAGDYVVVSITEVLPMGPDPGLVAWIRLITPAGVLQSSLSHTTGTEIAVTAATTGTYTVIVGTVDSGLDATGDYQLTFVKAPGGFAVAGGDEGGALTNGANHAGFVQHSDIDLWTFTVGSGEAVALSLGEVPGVDNGFVPWIRVIAPNGTLVGSFSNATVAQGEFTTTMAGLFTVLVRSNDTGFDGSGNYLLTLAKSGGFVVPAGDEGGAMTTGVNHTGGIHVGDLDQWRFFARAGNALSVAVTEDGSDVAFNPWIRLRSPAGTQIGSQSGATNASIVLAAPLTGYYTVVVSTADAGNDATGQYFVSVTGNDANPNLIQNGDFSNGTTGWQFFATPDLSYIVHTIVNGALHYYRVPPPAGTTNQAVAFQETGVSLATGVALMAQFDLGNSSSARKRISVLVIDSNFSDIGVCTFWLAPNAPMRTYQVKTHTTKAVANAALYFYAATSGQNGGFYQLDNVSLQEMPDQSNIRTDCVDPTAPTPPGGAEGPDLVVNGNFEAATIAPWFTFGTITSQLVNGVFEFIKQTNAPPAGVVLQPVSQTISANEILTARFDLGNSSGVRKRVTVILHDLDFSDLSACTFWLPPNLPLSPYSVTMFTTEAWANATLSVYPATTGFDQWIRLDNATLRRTPAAAMPGTACLEPGASLDVASPNPPRPGRGNDAEPTNPAPLSSAPTPLSAAAPANPPAVAGLVTLGAQQFWELVVEGDDERTLGLDDSVDLDPLTPARLTFESWLNAPQGSAEVHVRGDGTDWLRLAAVAPSDNWVLVDVDLSRFTGQRIEVRFAVVSPRPATGGPPVVWRIGTVQIVPTR